MEYTLIILEENCVSEEQIKEIYDRTLIRASGKPIEASIMASSKSIQVLLTYNDGWGLFIYKLTKSGRYEIDEKNAIDEKYEGVGGYYFLERNTIAALFDPIKDTATESIKKDFADKKPR